LEGEKYVTASFVAQAVITICTKLKAIANDHTSVLLMQLTDSSSTSRNVGELLIFQCFRTQFSVVP
jgi:hypothetical protein